MPVAEAPIDVRSFKGLNLREPEGMIQDDELSECINLNIGRAGELVKRTGFALLHDAQTLGLNQVRLIGHFLTDAYSQLIAQAGSNLYYSNDGATWTLIGAYTVEFGVQYSGKFYMCRAADTVLQWDGTTITAITGSPTGTFCTVYKDRLYVLNSKATGNQSSRLYFSAIADFSSTGWPSTNFVDVRPGDGDVLIACAVIHDLLLVFKTHSTWGLYVQGLPDNWILRNTNPEIGCISKYTPREIEGFLYFVGVRGAYKTDGNIYTDIGESINPLFRDRIVNQTTINIDVASWWDDRYILLLHPDPSTNRYFVHHLRTGGWTEWVPQGIVPAFFLEVNTAAPAKGLYCGDLNPTGRVFRYGGGAYTDAGVVFTATFSTKAFDFGFAHSLKRGKWMTLEFDGAGQVRLTHIADLNAQVDKVAQGVGSRHAYRLGGPGFFRVWKMKVSEISNGAFTFYGSTLWMSKKRPVVKAAT